MLPDDVYDLAWAGDPRLSPDGRTVAFVVTRIDREANDYRSAIFLAPVDRSSPPRRLTSGEKADAAPRWSPDGRELAFVSSRADDTKQLYVLPLEGGEARRLTSLKESVREPAWSPDGTQVAFTTRYTDHQSNEAEARIRSPQLFTRLSV
jgi:Tol biopolymer transport system component